MTRLLLALLVFLIAFPFFHNPVFAQDKNVITVSPQLIQLDLSKDKAEAEYFYTNQTDQTIELTLTMQDVKELEDRGIPGLLDAKESKNYKYGLSSWAKFSNNNIVVAPNETKKVTVYIDSSRLSIGGHYASVLAEIKQVDKQGPVKLRAILSSLLFVRQGSGNETEEARVYELKSTASLLSFPSSFTFRLNNTGNVDLTPHGRLSITDYFGKEVAFGIVNEDSLITLPESIRRYTIKIKKMGEFMFPGVYKAKLTTNYGKKKTEASAETTFVTTGSVPAWLFITIVITIVISAVGLFKLRRRNNSIK